MIPRLEKQDLIRLARVAKTPDGAFLVELLGKTLEQAKDQLVYSSELTTNLQGQAQVVQELLSLFKAAGDVMKKGS